MNNIEDNSNNFCTGCGACVSICPFSAIEYKLNKVGFYQAFVDESKCVKCGMCKKVCIKFNKEKKTKMIEGKLFSAKTKENKILEKVTSGGIAYEIAKYGIENGYYIAGVIYDYDENVAKTILTNQIEDLEKIKGSKYIQSNTCVAWETLLKKAQENKRNKFMVFGTPCQIFGLSKMLDVKKIKNEVVKIDLFCHGVPSYNVWNIYLREIRDKYNINKLEECNFRSKYYGWHQFCIQIKDSQKIINIDSGNSNFYKIFFDNMCLNKACYTCSVRKEDTVADIRLGDFWGRKYYSDQKGISAVLILNQIGLNIIENIKPRIDISDDVEFREFSKSQSITNYNNEELNNDILYELQFAEKLSDIIKKYRKKLPIKNKIKKIIKDVVEKTSPMMKYKLKYYYYKIKKG